MSNCYYCKKQLSINYEYYMVRAVIKKRNGPKFKRVGSCCDKCEKKGCALTIKDPLA